MCLLEVLVAVAVLSASLVIITETVFMARQQAAFCKAHLFALAEVEKMMFDPSAGQAEPLVLTVPGLEKEMRGQWFSVSWQSGRKEHGLAMPVFMPEEQDREQ